VLTVKHRLAAVRHLFDWLVRCQVAPANSAVSVRKRPIPRAAARRRCLMLVRRELLDAASVSALAPTVRRRVAAAGIGTGGATIRFTQ
jgi:hypothetical protein